MQYLTIVAVFHGQTDLSEEVKHLILSEVLKDASFRLLLMLVLDLGLEVAIVCVVHDYAQLALLGLVDFSEANDVGMAEDFEDLGLPQSLLALFITKLLNVNLFDNCKFSIGLALYQVGRAEGARAER